jgi:hypothetical protein
VDTIETVTARLPCQPYGHVEEIVFTHQHDFSHSVESVGNELIMFTTSSKIKIEDMKPKRIVIYDRVFHYRAFESIHTLRCLGRDARLSLQGKSCIDAGIASHSIAYATIEHHLSPLSPIPESKRFLGLWLAQALRSDHHSYKTPERFPLQLFDVSALLDAGDRPKYKHEVSQLARNILEANMNDWNSQSPEMTKAMLDRIDFRDSEDGQEEYPVLKPRPVSHTLDLLLLGADTSGSQAWILPIRRSR